MKTPVFSIITIAKNAGGVIGGTLESVVTQTFTDFEHIIIDGASTDDTLAMVRRHDSPRMRVVSEKDTGIANAMNKGVRLSSGRLIIHLNAGDALATPDILARVATDHAEFGWEWAIGSCDSVDVDRGIIQEKRIRAFDFDSLRRVNFINHQSTFVARTVFERFGLFDETFGLGMDYDFWLRIGRSVTPRILPFVVARFLKGGISSNIVRSYWEGCRARIKNRTGVAECVFFETRHFALNCALYVTGKLTTGRARDLVKRNKVYALLRRTALGPHYLNLNAMFTETIRKYE